MCRILGEICFNSKVTDSEEFHQLNMLSKNGGPDSTQYWKDNYCQLGFNRLAILDLSEAGNQPITSPSGRYIMLFNGEVYNHNELKEKYKISSGELRSSSDTEIIIQCFDKHGIQEVMPNLNGMYAIALYDRERKKVHLLRDFAGIKPLFYGISSKGIVFASQFNQIYKHNWFSQQQTDANGLRDYVQLGFMQAPNTIYKNIYQLTPGEHIEVNIEAKAYKTKKLFNFFTYPGKSEECDSESLRKFDEAFNYVIKDQLISDVSLGAFLSGGIDSPLVSSYAKRNKHDITSYTVGVDDPNTNEAAIALEYAKHLSLKNQLSWFTSKELLQINDEHFKAFPEPFGDYSSLPTFFITAKARKHFTVMLSGDGGDELFWGYPRFPGIANYSEWFKYPRMLRKFGAKMKRWNGEKIPYGTGLKTIGEWHLEKHSHNKNGQVNKMLPNISLSEEVLRLYDYPSVKGRVDLYNWFRYNEFYSHLQRVLIKVDRASMHNSLEVRVPFLDKRIIDFSQNLIPEIGKNHQVPKWLLKESMRSFFPDNLINQRKMGFSIPIEKWLKNELKEEVCDLIMDRNAFASEFFNRKYLENYLDTYYKKNAEGNTWGIWILYALQKWNNVHNS